MIQRQTSLKKGLRAARDRDLLVDDRKPSLLLRVVIAGLPKFEKFMVGGLTKILEVSFKESSFLHLRVKAVVTRSP